MYFLSNFQRGNAACHVFIHCFLKAVFGCLRTQAQHRRSNVIGQIDSNQPITFHVLFTTGVSYHVQNVFSRNFVSNINKRRMFLNFCTILPLLIAAE